ncbi:MAG: hypothetical protein A2119_00105 [Candidatus Colwellbacteria bacterium GWA2_46_10]|uniref:Uncharacterized protein n=1 Tax=Candidatus Colwellbacteria bacterium GWA2_46_10 TaxID=1797684 RepID=A0A1G1YVS3_9BACT|nr:MAG: hypothetical protein UX29_C0002G0022 [Parcubacteria group bacterium GW2011_GWA2_46_10]OGY56483.1 MAG: hypothetical protein A2119_00105 [Candidatus Colwellbacteria bacterium GWA2_46_10]
MSLDSTTTETRPIWRSVLIIFGSLAFWAGLVIAWPILKDWQSTSAALIFTGLLYELVPAVHLRMKDPIRPKPIWGAVPNCLASAVMNIIASVVLVALLAATGVLALWPGNGIWLRRARQ